VPQQRREINQYGVHKVENEIDNAMIHGRFLVRGNTTDSNSGIRITGSTGNGNDNYTNDIDIDNDNHNDTEDIQISVPVKPMLVTDTSISFWGGIDPLTGIVIDRLHPLYNQCITDTILCIPSTRGSCTTSQVLLELLYNHKAPHTIIVRDIDALLCIGAIIAQEFFAVSISNVSNIICIGHENYTKLLLQQQQLSSKQQLYGYVSSSGVVHTSTWTKDEKIPYTMTLTVPATEMNITTSSTAPDNANATATATTATASIQDDIGTGTSESLGLPVQPVPVLLTDEEQYYFNQCTTDAQRKAFHVIFRYAKLSWSSSNDDHSNKNNSSTNPNIKSTNQSEKKYIQIKQAHIDGCTYIGPGGIQFVQLLIQYNGQVRVPTTLNSISTDIRYWQQYNISKQYAMNAITLSNAYIELGCQPTYTCAPYLLLSSATIGASPSSTSISSTTGDKTATNDTNNSSSSNTSNNILLGQDIAWGESNAVVYANSVLGARTEKYADYLDICCAITGIVPKIGVHNIEQRTPTMVIDGTILFQMIQSLMEYTKITNQNVTAATTSNATPTLVDLDLLFPILGHLCGTISDGRVPILIGLEHDISYWTNVISTDHLKSFCAAFGTTASSPLIHIAGITPEAKDTDTIQAFISSCKEANHPCEIISLERLSETFQKLNTNVDPTIESIDLIALGNPHLSVTECYDIARIIEQINNPIDTTSFVSTSSMPPSSISSTAVVTRIIACISRSIYAQADPNDVHIMKQFGIEFIYDTCWCMIFNEPIIPNNPEAIILTNSGKYAHYGPGLTKRQFRLGSMYDCIHAARYGAYPYRTEHQQQVQQSSNTTIQSKLSQSTLLPSSSSKYISSSNEDHRRYIDPYLSFLIRPSSQHNRYQHHQVRRYSTMTTSSVLQLLLSPYQQRMKPQIQQQRSLSSISRRRSFFQTIFHHGVCRIR
jgi:predicted aconitase/predicted aconitase with swiveling domain